MFCLTADHHVALRRGGGGRGEHEQATVGRGGRLRQQARDVERPARVAQHAAEVTRDVRRHRRRQAVGTQQTQQHQLVEVGEWAEVGGQPRGARTCTRARKHAGQTRSAPCCCQERVRHAQRPAVVRSGSPATLHHHPLD